MDQYVLAGNPVAHSKSPQIHAAFAKATGQDMDYGKLLIPVDDFKEGVAAFLAQGGKGLNVTVPFKEDAWKIADIRSERATLAGAVNTLYVNEQGQLCADNTDGFGIVTDITKNYGVDLTGKRILMMGAGGAVRGAILPFLDEKPAEIVIANRTVLKAQDLADTFAEYGLVSASAYEDLNGYFDVIVNGTSASLNGTVPVMPDGLVDANSLCYDMMYGAEPTTFLRWAQAQGVNKCVDGLGMLVEQAAESFYIWRGVRPETAEVTRSIREQLLSA